MNWLLIAVYLLAGATIARMAWEFDAFEETAVTARDEKFMCWMLVLTWPIVPAWGAWMYVTSRRR